ncbi:MAG: N-acetylneuraminate synthase [Elusimicrobia bacterium]|nr:N-acetylneuraminate synthase [Elusimicrobiota bacterium]
MSKVFIIAEAGVNHNGSLAIARRLVSEAAKAGADAVKFQTFRADAIAAKNAPKAMYQKKTTPKMQNQYQMLKALELNESDHRVLIAYCRTKKIKFISSPFDVESVRLLGRLGLDTIKIPSGEITNFPYLREIGKMRKNILLSTGMADKGEIAAALKILVGCGTSVEKITILHCNTEYPTPFQDANLNAIVFLKKHFRMKTGYSDHTTGIEAALAAVALGAEVIEKHFTLDRKMRGPDHKASIEPGELKRLVTSVRNIESALGKTTKTVTNSERENRGIVRKSVFAAVDIAKGELFSEKNLTTKRPGTGISPMLWDRIIGKKSVKKIPAGSMVKA